MRTEKKKLGADAAEVVTAGSIDTAAASHADRMCETIGSSTSHYTAKDGDTVCQCGMVDLSKPVCLFEPPISATPEPSLSTDRSIAAMAEFSAAIRDLPKNEQRAAIYWLADYFLGIKLWGRW